MHNWVTPLMLNYCYFAFVDPTVRSAGYYSTAPENGVKVNNVVCNGSEPRLLNCPHENLINLGDYAAAAMECQQGKCVPILH